MTAAARLVLPILRAALAVGFVAACGAEGDADASGAGGRRVDGDGSAGLASDSGASGDGAVGDASAPDPDDGVPPPARVYDAPALYAEMCAGCHGPHGEGAAGPPLTRSYQRDYLAEYIDAKMPLGNPERCDAGCAAALADFILGDLLAAPPPDCESVVPGPRALRLLSRREYRNTIRDLLGGGSAPEPGPACEALADCDHIRESCVGGHCAADPCATHTFVFDAAGRDVRSVHVAGSFNDWAPTVVAGGWPLELNPALGRWVAKHEVPDGEHTYKLVLDERDWITDPSNPETSPDGFGGQNSVLRRDCGAAPPPAGEGPALDLETLTRDLPPETRPRGFDFETHASAGVVTPVHVEVYLTAAQRVALAVADAADAGALPQPEVFLADFGTRAFRRPLTAEETARYAALWRTQSEPREGLAATVEALLSSPHFLYRSEMGTLQPDGTYRLTPHEVAAALSYTFWATTPDRELLIAAADGTLDTAEGIEREARRLLADPRARGQIGAFGLQWLGVETLATREKRADLFPVWDAALAHSMLEETRLFVESAFFDEPDGVDTLLRGQHTFADARLAALYGLPGSFDANFTRADLTTLERGPRAGLLGHGSVLATTAHSDQTSPIRRGLFVRERLLCTIFGTPPADAGGVPDVDPNATTRERFRQHTAEERCAACHRYIDGVGFGFERFDAIGAYRETEAGQPIDSTGNLNDVEGLGTSTEGPYEGLPALGDLLGASDRAGDCLAAQVWRFQRGRLESAADTCDLDDVRAQLRAAGGDLRALMIAPVLTPAFTLRREAAQP